MKIENVLITNWTAPGGEYWGRVSASPDDPLIEARLDMVLTHREYKELLDRDRGYTDQDVIDGKFLPAYLSAGSTTPGPADHKTGPPAPSTREHGPVTI